VKTEQLKVPEQKEEKKVEPEDVKKQPTRINRITLNTAAKELTGKKPSIVGQGSASALTIT
jgi:hypothetical protein